jgi:hypothetical protein
MLLLIDPKSEIRDAGALLCMARFPFGLRRSNGPGVCSTAPGTIRVCILANYAVWASSSVFIGTNSGFLDSRGWNDLKPALSELKCTDLLGRLCR